jgi:hypothetical protein
MCVGSIVNRPVKSGAGQRILASRSVARDLLQDGNRPSGTTGAAAIGGKRRKDPIGGLPQALALCLVLN